MRVMGSVWWRTGLWVAAALLLSAAVGEVREVEQRDLPCALQWSGWAEKTVGNLCGSMEEKNTVEELIPCGKREGESRVLFVGDSLVRDLFVVFLQLLDVPLSWEWTDYRGHRSFDVVVRKGESRRAILPLTRPPTSQQGEESKPLLWREPEVEEAIVEMSDPPCDGLTLSFRWAPFVRNVTRVFGREELQKTTLVLDSGLWDLLHIHNDVTLKRDLRELSTLLGHMWGSSQSVVWLSPGKMQSEIMPTEEKQRYLTDTAVEGLLSALYDAFGISPIRLRLFDMRHTMTFAASVESEFSLTTDGVHLPEELLRSIVPNILAYWREEREARRLPSPIRLLPYDRVRETEGEKAKQSPTHSPGFIGSDPFLGALVGLYFALTVFTGDILIVSRPLLWILEP